MALILSAASGNFNAGATWVGGIVPSAADEARASTGHTVTITADVTCAELSNAGTGIFTLNNGVTLTANVTNKSSTGVRHCLQFTDASPAVGFIVGNVTGSALSNGSFGAQNSSTGTLTITGTVTGGPGTGSGSVNNASTGTITITGSVTGGQNSGNSFGAQNSSTGTITITGNVIGGAATGSIGANNSSTGTLTIIGSVTAASVTGVNNTSTGTLTITGDMKASTSANAVSSANASSVVRASGSFFSASNGMVAVYAPKFILLTTPIASKTQYALNGTSTYVDMFTSDNNPNGGVATTDVRLGVSYGGGLVGTCAVPNAGTVAFGVAVGNTTGTATLTADNLRAALGLASANLDTQLAALPTASANATAVWAAGSRTLTAGAGISASDVWSHASRTITGGLVDTATTLTNAPTVPSVVQIRQEMDSNSTKLANLDATVSSRLASSVSTNITAIKAKTDLLNTDRLAQCATTSIVGNLIAQSNS